MKHSFLHHPRHLKARPLVLLLAAALLPLAPAAQPLPSGLNVVSGQASAQVSGGQMTVTNSANAILNWQSFSIGAGNGVHFAQPNAASQVLNRVTGNDPSAILGSLSSNGRVWLLNPNGVLFGQSARVDVAGLVTSTLNLSNEDWLAGRHVFSGHGAGATIVNEGQLRTSLGGRVALLGGTVENHGLIEAPGGQVVLAAGRSVELLDTGAPHLTVKVTAPQGEALNLGTLAAAGGRIDVHGAAVNQQGIVRADSLERGPAGEVLLKASERLSLKAGSVTAADGERGGRVALLGREVGLFDDAAVSASGRLGGGEVLVGGGQQGKDASVPNAQALFFGREARIHADAVAQGDGGRIILWSNESTRAFGTLSAHGGAQGGNGGFIETSGGWLDAQPLKLDLGAPKGQAGHWLLDPYNIRISDNVEIEGGFSPGFRAWAPNAEIRSSTLLAALDAGVAVTVYTGGSGYGNQAGTITVEDATLWLGEGTTGARLTLRADSDIFVRDSQIQGNFGLLSLLAGGSGSGRISLNNSRIFSTGAAGQVLLGGFGTGTTAGGGSFGNAAVANDDEADAVSLTAGSQINAPASTVTLNGHAARDGRGVLLDVGTEVTARHLLINGSSATGDGVSMSSSQLGSTGSVLISGHSGGGGIGVGIYDGSSVVVSPGVFDSGALLSVQGRSSGSNYGVLIDSPLAQSALLGTYNGAALQLSAANQSDGVPALHLIGNGSESYLLDGSGGGPMSLSVFGDGDTVAFYQARVRGSSQGLTVSASTQVFEDSQLYSAGPISLQGDRIFLYDASSIHSSRIGDAILLSNGSAPLSTFVNEAGAEALQVEGGGRWIVWANVLSGANFQPGGLVYDFTRYGASSPAAWSADAGNGFVTAQLREVDIYGSAEVRAYDGTRKATVGELAYYSNLGGVTGALNETAYALFDSKDVLTGYGGYGGYGDLFSPQLTPIQQRVQFYDDSNASPFRFTDAQDKPVYGLSIYTSIWGLIGPKFVTASASVASKVYDASTSATITAGGISGLVGSETLNISALGSFSDKNVGQNKPVSAEFVVADGSNGGLASNYVVQTPTGLSGNITPATLGIGGLSANSKVYDAGTVASLSGTAFVNALGEDLVSLVGSAQGSFSDKNVGSGKAVTVVGLSLAGQDAGNYVLASTGLSADITPATLTLNGLSANSKVYDATTAATLSGAASIGGLGADQLSLSGGQASFLDKNVGQGKTVLLSGFTLGGADAGNYNLQLPASLTADITPAPLSLQGVAVAAKVYDATTGATLSGTPQLLALGNDQLSLGGGAQASFVDKHVGTAKPVLLSGLTLAGADAGNYSLQLPTNLTADITPAPLSLAGLSVNSKVYDATTVATLSGTPSVSGFAGDQLSLGGGTAQFADKNVGRGKTVTLSGFALGGADAGNYRLQLPGELSADISPAPLVLAGLSVNGKVYDATTVATLSGAASISGFAGDQLSLGGGTAQFADKNVGQGKAVALSGFTLGGADAGNYRLQLPGDLSADITPAPLLVTGLRANNKVYDGSTLASLAGTATITPLGSDQLSLTGDAQAQFGDRNVGSAKPVTVSGLALAGADAGNYQLQPPATLRADITHATLRYVAQTLTLFTGDALPAVGGSVEGFVAGDTLQNATSGALVFSSSVSNTLAPAGGYAISGSGLQALNYVLVQDPGNAQALVLAGPNPANALNQGGAATLGNSVQAAAVQAPAANPLLSGLIDMMAAPAAGVASPAGSAALAASAAAATASTESFGRIRIADMSQESLADLLNARDRYKKSLFADALSRLEQDPTLADLRACKSLKEVEAGTCLVTAELKSAARAEQASPSAPSAAPAATEMATQAVANTPAAAAAAVVAQLPQLSKRRVKAAALPQIERKVALLIGVDEYADPGIPKLSNAIGDARAVGRLFESKLGYETMVLANASKQAVVTALNRLALELGPRDSVVVYYAGHGELVESSKQGYWQLADSDAKKPETWLSNSDIARLVSQIGASQVAVISDSCYSGTLAGGERIRATPGTVDPGQVLARRSVVVMSSGGNEPVFDEGKQGHSPFAWNLMSQLNNVSNWQLGGNVFERVRFAVARELPQRPQYGAAAGHQSGGDYLFEQRQLDVN